MRYTFAPFFLLCIALFITPCAFIQAAPERPNEQRQVREVRESAPTRTWDSRSYSDEADITSENTVYSSDDSTVLKAQTDQRLHDRAAASRFREGEVVIQFADESRPQRVVRSDRTVDELLLEYRSRQDVVYVEPNFIATAQYVPNDQYYALQWNFDNTVYGGVHAEAAWDITDGSGVVIAIVDTGVAYENYTSGGTQYYQAPDLARTHFVDGYDFANNDTHANDDEGHGTHVAGTIAETTGNNTGVAGLAHGATIMPVKVLDKNGSGTYFDVAEGIRYAVDHGAQVINLSLGGPDTATYLEDAVRYAYEKGVTIVAAAGNEGRNGILYPAAYDDFVIAVGATRYNETRASYSNFGSSLDIVAPGGDTSVDQNGDGYVDGILQQTFGGALNNFNYYFYQGTSMATPHVAAAAAMLVARGIGNPVEVRTALESTADDLGSPGRDNQYGYGLLNIAEALAAIDIVELPPEPTDTPPSVTLISPTDGAIVSGTTTIIADVSDDKGVDYVEFYVDGDPVWNDTATPYEVVWSSLSVGDGVHTFTVIAYDSASQTTSDAINVLVQNTVEPPQGEVTVYEESFEDGLDDWMADSQNDWSTSRRESTHGKRSATVDGRANDSYIESQAIDLLGRTHVDVSFDWFIDRSFDPGEYLAFDISEDGGSTWIEIGKLLSGVDEEDVWHHVIYNFEGLTSLKLRFRGSMSSATEDGYVDALSVVVH